MHEKDLFVTFTRAGRAGSNLAKRIGIANQRPGGTFW